MLTLMRSSAVMGIDAYTVVIEVDASRGLPSYSLVGLPDTAVKEGKERIFSAIKNSSYSLPPLRIVINLAPADVRKEGSAYDLPIALALMKSAGAIAFEENERTAFLGELSLDGSLRPIRGILPMAIGAREQGYTEILVPADNAKEAAVAQGLRIIPIKTLSDAVKHLTSEKSLEPFKIDICSLLNEARRSDIDFSDVKGQAYAKRAIEVAASGGHNILMQGPPGSGKTMLARRIPTILPDMTLDEALEATKIHSVAGLLPRGMALIAARPFRSPHHTLSEAALAGGGTYHLRPGEVSLAHNGLLFLDELPEFKKSVLEVLRQPLEDGETNICRISSSLTFPSRFMLAVAMNPCPCGYLGDTNHGCSCTDQAVSNYRSRLSGPLLDRIDLHVDVPALNRDELGSTAQAESSASIKERVNRAREKQLQRFSKLPGIFCNARMGSKQIRSFCQLSPECNIIIRNAIDRLGLSARAYDRVLKVARTVADLDDAEIIAPQHLCEAIQYRSLDRMMGPSPTLRAQEKDQDTKKVVLMARATKV